MSHCEDFGGKLLWVSSAAFLLLCSCVTPDIPIIPQRFTHTAAYEGISMDGDSIQFQWDFYSSQDISGLVDQSQGCEGDRYRVRVSLPFYTPVIDSVVFSLIKKGDAPLKYKKRKEYSPESYEYVKGLYTKDCNILTNK